MRDEPLGRSAAPRPRRARPDATTDRPRRAGRAARAAGTRPRSGRRRGGACAPGSRATPSSSATSRSPVDEPMNTLMPAHPAAARARRHRSAFSRVPPTQKAKSQCMRSRGRAASCRRALPRVVVSGLVLGISKTAVTPPITAAREPVSRSSLCSRPGSRKCTWVSMTPGRTWRPRQSMVSPALAASKVADRGDAAAAARRYRAACAVLIDDRAALEDQVVGRRHGARRPCRCLARGLRNDLPICKAPSRHADRPSRRPRLIAVEGADAETSCRTSSPPTSRARDGEARPGALLSPQGKILFDFLISRAGDTRFLLDCRARSPTISCAGYALQAAGQGDDRQAGSSACRGFMGSGFKRLHKRIQLARRHALRDAASATRRFCATTALPLPAANAPRPTACAAASPMALPKAARTMRWATPFPHDVLLDENGGVGFRKGCYVGQEVVSRMQHRGTARRRVMIVPRRPPCPPPAPTPGRTAGDRHARHRRRRNRARDRPHRPGQGSARRRAADHRRRHAVTLAHPAWRQFIFPEDAAGAEDA